MTRFAGNHPRYLQDAVDHASRLIDTLAVLEPSSQRRSAELWLVGRAEEIDCVVRSVLVDWRTGRLDNSNAARSIQAYVALLHRGLATHFGELAPSCCMHSLVVTASLPSYRAPTSSFPPSAAPTRSLASTWDEVDEDELELDSSPTLLRRPRPALPPPPPLPRPPSLAVTWRPSSSG